MKISIIIPVYNVAPYLRECLDSIVNQGDTLIEVFLINDGSTDDSESICEEYIASYEYFTLINQANSGQSAARNAGLKRATGDYIWFVDSDDWLAKDSFKVLRSHLAQSDVDLFAFCFQNSIDGVISDSEWNHYETISTCSPNEFLATTKYFFTSPWLRVFKSTFLKANGITFVESIFHEDDYFNYQSLNVAQKIQKIPDVLYHYRILPESNMRTLSYDVILKRINSLFFIIDHLSNFHNLDRAYLVTRKKAYYNYITATAEKYCKSHVSFALKLKLIKELKKSLPQVVVTKDDFKQSKAIWLQKQLYNLGTYFYCSYLTLVK
jgi:glycosyltransferase involved in cell wall biosynthesis